MFCFSKLFQELNNFIYIENKTILMHTRSQNKISINDVSSFSTSTLANCLKEDSEDRKTIKIAGDQMKEQIIWEEDIEYLEKVYEKIKGIWEDSRLMKVQHNLRYLLPEIQLNMLLSKQRLNIFESQPLNKDMAVYLQTIQTLQKLTSLGQFFTIIEKDEKSFIVWENDQEELETLEVDINEVKRFQEKQRFIQKIQQKSHVFQGTDERKKLDRLTLQILWLYRQYTVERRSFFNLSPKLQFNTTPNQNQGHSTERIKSMWKKIKQLDKIKKKNRNK